MNLVFLLLAIFLTPSSETLLTIPIWKLNKRIQKGDQSTPLNSYNDNTYVGTVSLGTPAQNFNVVFSTVNSDFWVVDSSCSDQQCLGYPEAGYNKNKFDKTKSSTYTSSENTFCINFGSGLCTGPVYFDNLSIGGYNIANQTFGSASHIPEVFGYVAYDGILGLGLSPSSSNSDKIVPIVQNIVSQLPDSIVVVFLDRYLSPSLGTPGGLITFGAIDQKNCDPDILYVPLSSETSWQFALDKFQFASYTSKKSAQAISDTSTDSIGLPNTAFSTMMKILNADFDATYELYTVSCDVMKSSPKMLFTIGGAELFVESFEYILDYGLNNGNCAVAAFDMGDASSGVDYVLSEPFIRTYCNVYSIAEQKIGFTRARHYNF